MYVGEFLLVLALFELLVSSGNTHVVDGDVVGRDELRKTEKRDLVCSCLMA